MGEATSNKEVNKLSYDELKKIADQYAQQVEYAKKQINELYKRYQEAMEVVIGKRLDGYLKVLEYTDKFSPEFITFAIQQIEWILGPEQKESSEKFEPDPDSGCEYDEASEATN